MPRTWVLRTNCLNFETVILFQYNGIQQRNTMDSSDDDSDFELQSYTWALPLISLMPLLADQRQPKTPTNRTWTSQEYVDNVLNCGNPTCIHNVLRMNLETFNQLQDWLVNNTKLRRSQKVSIEEKLFIFIAIASTRLSNCCIQEHYNCSARTVS